MERGPLNRNESGISATGKLISAIVAIVLISAGAFAVWSVVTEEEEELPDQVGVVWTEPGRFDPVSTTEDAADWIFASMYDRLVRTHPDGEVNTGGRTLAEDFSISDDGLTYSFELEEGVMFDHGEEMTAEDVAYIYDKSAVFILSVL